MTTSNISKQELIEDGMFIFINQGSGDKLEAYYSENLIKPYVADFDGDVKRFETYEDFEKEVNRIVSDHHLINVSDI